MQKRFNAKGGAPGSGGSGGSGVSSGNSSGRSELSDTATETLATPKTGGGRRAFEETVANAENIQAGQWRQGPAWHVATEFDQRLTRV